ncbi:hypothetical protein FA15DRAFT_634886, partial [Coprinopsis marcescibilis]
MANALAYSSNPTFNNSEVKAVNGHCNTVHLSVSSSSSYALVPEAAVRAVLEATDFLWIATTKLVRLLGWIGAWLWASGVKNEKMSVEVIPLDAEHVDLLCPRSEACRVPGREIYYRMMIGAVGIPLWNPRPISLPPDRQSEGVIPGDVGILTSNGAFDYLFNIWADADVLSALDG